MQCRDTNTEVLKFGDAHGSEFPPGRNMDSSLAEVDAWFEAFTQLPSDKLPGTAEEACCTTKEILFVGPEFALLGQSREHSFETPACRPNVTKHLNYYLD